MDLAHRYWAQLIQAGDLVVDATCGNGHDTLFLAQLVGNKGLVYAYDIQPQAIDRAKALLEREGMASRVCWKCESHENLCDILNPRLIVFNLGYLPGSDKTIKTRVGTTLASVQHAMAILSLGGVISITAYSGHPEGAEEEAALLQWVADLPKCWNCTFHQWPNRKQSPGLLLLQKAW